MSVPKKKSKSSPLVDFNELNGKTFALIVEEASGEGVAFNGIARWDGQRLYWDREGLARPIEIPERRLKSVRRTAAADRALIGDAEYLVFLTIGNLPDDTPHEDHVTTGREWPP